MTDSSEDGSGRSLDENMSALDDPDECSECHHVGFDLIPAVVVGESEPRNVCEWCHIELLQSGLIDHDRENELGMWDVIDRDGRSIEQ